MNTMFDKVKSTMSSREFQTGVGRVGIMVVNLVVTSVVSNLVAKGLNAGLETIMDKIHGEAVDGTTTTE